MGGAARGVAEGGLSVLVVALFEVGDAGAVEGVGAVGVEFDGAFEQVDGFVVLAIEEERAAEGEGGPAVEELAGVGEGASSGEGSGGGTENRRE